MQLGKVSAISLDLDDTLWPFHGALMRAETALHAWLITHAPKSATVLPTWQALGEWRDRYAITRPDLDGDFQALRMGSIRHLLELANEDVTLTEDAYGVFYAARQNVEFFEDALPALAWLSTRFPLVAVSNGNANLQLTGGGEFFRATLSAAVFGHAKPHYAIFHAAADSVGVPPREMLHVGDDFDLDVVGALNAGLQAAWVVRDVPIEPNRRALPPEIAHLSHLTIADLSLLCVALGGPDRLLLAAKA